ncbi:ATP-binding protein [Spirosoma sp. KNUC1025]|uniref:ATP-binding protein n=1 Tax=Spirosoma sp. KNUC1025 TaxID=2894082 RepID=UPI0038650940|nr:ATP-binding protein [Spirosoma sp. KNUC1025]
MQPPSVYPSINQVISLLNDVLFARLTTYFEQQPFSINQLENDPRWQQVDEWLQVPDTYAQTEKLILLLAVVPHILPGFFEGIIAQTLPQGGEFVEFGGVKGTQHRGMLPTGETALFVLAGTDVAQRLMVQSAFAEHAHLTSSGLLRLESVKEGEPAMSGRLLLDHDWLEKLLFRKEVMPTFGAEFPARRVETLMTWDDLVLHPQTMEQISDIRLWMQHHEQMMQDAVLARKIKPGYRVLFYGPAGTGKTLTTMLIGKEYDLPVYRIDLSQVVSKYIGETEKHIEWVFNRASRKKWILFFDEADALFGKRTNVQSAHDKYANQEVSYLLQRIEEYDGLLILASNFKNNIDDAFLRRFHSLIHFPIPSVNERQKLWSRCVPASLTAESGINWEDIARQYEITGAGIVNVMQYALLRSFARKSETLLQRDIIEGIRKEFRKEEKAF